jgi:hypothetical protein
VSETGAGSVVELSVRPLVIAELARILGASADAEVVLVADVVVGMLRERAPPEELTPARFAAKLAELCDAGEAAGLVESIWRLLPRAR